VTQHPQSCISNPDHVGRYSDLIYLRERNSFYSSNERYLQISISVNETQDCCSLQQTNLWFDSFMFSETIVLGCRAQNNLIYGKRTLRRAFTVHFFFFFFFLIVVCCFYNSIDKPLANHNLIQFSRSDLRSKCG